jgi:hypothetical protein
MFGKRRTLALAVTTAGLIGMSASMAAAAINPGGDAAGLVNIAHNQVPVQLCNDFVPVNVIGVQVPAQDLAGALGLLSPGSRTTGVSDTSCHQKAGEADNNGSVAIVSSGRHTMYRMMSAPVAQSATDYGMGWGGPRTVIINNNGSTGDAAGLLNVSDNEVPIQACNITVPVNGIGVQVPVDHIAGGLGLLAPAGTTTAAQDSSCHSSTGQANNNG